MKKVGKVLVAATILCMLTACSQAKNTPVSNQSDHTQPTDRVVEEKQEAPGTETPEPVILTEEDQVRKAMVERSLLGEGNNSRMKKVIEKAHNGEEVTIAYIGGSITEGYNAGTQEIFAKRSSDYFRETYATGKVNYVNAGLSGTTSLLGLVRSERDVFSYKPDVVMIEFAVNDSQDTQAISGFESLVRKALTQEQEPAVILLFSVVENGYTCQNTMQIIGHNYQLPMISVKAALEPEFEAGRMTWSDWSNDGSHPNAYGQALYSDFITHYWNVIDAAEESDAYIVRDEALYLDFSDMIMVDKNSLVLENLGAFHEESGHNAFPNGWVKSSDSKETSSFTFELSCKSLFLVYKQVNSEEYGAIEVFVDGESMRKLYGNVADGWNNPVVERVFREKESRTRKVEIRMQAGDEEKAFALLAIAYCP